MPVRQRAAPPPRPRPRGSHQAASCSCGSAALGIFCPKPFLEERAAGGGAPLRVASCVGSGGRPRLWDGPTSESQEGRGGDRAACVEHRAEVRAPGGAVVPGSGSQCGVAGHGRGGCGRAKPGPADPALRWAQLIRVTPGVCTCFPDVGPRFPQPEHSPHRAGGGGDHGGVRGEEGAASRRAAVGSRGGPRGKAGQGDSRYVPRPQRGGTRGPERRPAGPRLLCPSVRGQAFEQVSGRSLPRPRGRPSISPAALSGAPPPPARGSGFMFQEHRGASQTHR